MVVKSLTGHWSAGVWLSLNSATFNNIRKDQATTYSFGVNVGLSFIFGSMFSNIVNPRFE